MSKKASRKKDIDFDENTLTVEPAMVKVERK